MKSIDTLIADIHQLVDKGNLHEFAVQHIGQFADKLSIRIQNRLVEEQRGSYLRLSSLGTRCARQLYLKINRPDVVERLPPATKIKFLYGDILEELVLWLAKESGHDVKDEQREVTINGVTGHIDAIIDGVLVDVKSASTPSFKKFAAGLTTDTDDFGYLTQLDSYLQGLGLPLGAFLAIDKTLGNLTMDFHDRTDRDYSVLIDQRKAELSSGALPPRAYFPEADGKSGNEKLGTACSYCPVKNACWPGLRTFAYANAPRFLTTVRSLPDVPEVT